MDASSMPCQALVKMLAKKPGWKETNFQVSVDGSWSSADSSVANATSVLVNLVCVCPTGDADEAPHRGPGSSERSLLQDVSLGGPGWSGG